MMRADLELHRPPVEALLLPGGELVPRAEEGKTAPGLDGHPVRQPDPLGQLVGHQDHAAPAIPELLKDVPEEAGGVEVEPGEGLVQEDQGRIVEEGPGQGQALPHPPREPAGPAGPRPRRARPWPALRHPVPRSATP
jgi:hypothetical protein